jgi:hypothetical protein
MGQRAANDMAADLDALMTSRFKPVFENYLAVLRGGVQKCFGPNDVPPLALARVESETFLQNVQQLKGKDDK